MAPPLPARAKTLSLHGLTADAYARALGHEPEDFPNALEIGERTFSIPLSPKVTDEDVEDVVAAVRDALS